MVLAVELWCGRDQPTLLLGDNTAALQESLDLKGKGVQSKLAQVLAVLRCSRSLVLEVGHLPSEANVAADALSRQDDETRAPWPFRPEEGVQRDQPLSPAALWEWIR